MKSIADSFPIVFKQMLPANFIFALVALYVPGMITFFLSILLLGMLYVAAYAVQVESAPYARKDLLVIARKKYLPFVGLTLAVYGICLFALVSGAVPLGLLPNFIFAKILSYTFVGICLLAIFISLCIATTIYLSYSFMFFWFDNQDILTAMRKSYDLVKGQWWRAAFYIFISNILPAIFIVIIPAGLFSTIGISKVAIGKFILLFLGIAVLWPLQVLANSKYFLQLKEGKI